MKSVFWDTNLFIYLLEGESQHSAEVRTLRNRMLERKDELVTSTMTVAELQVGPRKSGHFEMANRYREVLPRVARIVTFDLDAADHYARIRGNHSSVRGPDAVQLACAVAGKADFFVTNDMRLQKLRLEGTTILPLDLSLRLLI